MYTRLGVGGAGLGRHCPLSATGRRVRTAPSVHDGPTYPHTALAAELDRGQRSLSFQAVPKVTDGAESLGTFVVGYLKSSYIILHDR